MLERSLAERPVLLIRPDAAISLGSFAMARASGFGDEPPPAYAIDGEIATLSIEGPLYQKSISMCGFMLADGYDAILSRATAAFNDPAVGAVMLSIDSPGGDAAGVLELADALAAMSAESGKPLMSYAAESAASAAYWLASAGSEIMLPRSGEAGSIGAIVMGINRAGELAALGRRAIVAAYPSGKSAGWDAMLAPPDSAEAKAGRDRMQARAEEIARLFAGDVAQRRGMTLDAVLALDAAMVSGERAVAAGLADRVGSFSAAKDHLRSKVKRKVYSMDISKNQGAASALVTVLALGGLATEGPERTPEEVSAALKEVERLTTLGKAVEASTGQRGDAALEVTKAWRDGAAQVPALVTRIKVEALQGRLATAYPPAERFALAPALAADGKPHPRAGLPDPSAGPHERFASLSLAVFDVQTSTGTVHPALSAPPRPDTDANSKWRAEAIAKGVDPATYIQARKNIEGAL